jgi:hypothetical protein
MLLILLCVDSVVGISMASFYSPLAIDAFDMNCMVTSPHSKLLRILPCHQETSKLTHNKH